MNLRGHVGFTLTVLSLAFMLLDLRDFYYVKVLVLSAGFSSLPDIDLRIGLPHRRYTHNLIFVAATSILFGYLTSTFLNDFNLGFYSVIAAGVLHIISDVMTYMGFTPFYPLSSKNIALRLFKSNNRFVNNFLAVSGTLLLVIYLKSCYNI